MSYSNSRTDMTQGHATPARQHHPSSSASRPGRAGFRVQTGFRAGDACYRDCWNKTRDAVSCQDYCFGLPPGAPRQSQ